MNTCNLQSPPYPPPRRSASASSSSASSLRGAINGSSSVGDDHYARIGDGVSSAILVRVVAD